MAGRFAPARRPVAAAAVRGTASPWPLTTPASSVPSLRTRVLAPPFGFSPFDRGGAAAVTMAARHRGVAPFIPSDPLVMTVIFTFAALAARLPRRLF